MTARHKCKKLQQQRALDQAILEFLLPIIEKREQERRQLALQVADQQQSIDWYQELYDKARKAQIASAEEAEALRRENAQLRAELGRPRPLLQRLFG